MNIPFNFNMNIPYSLPCLGCKTFDKQFDKLKFPLYMQPKLRGIRARYWTGTKRFYSRDNKTWDENVVQHLVDKLTSAFPDIPPDIMLDGEFYCHDYTQGEHTSAISVKLSEPNELTSKIKFRIYDFWKPGNLPRDYGMRQMVLVKNNTPDILDFRYANNEKEMWHFYTIWQSQGFEGAIIINGRDCPYVDRKTKGKLKWKDTIEDEFICTGYTKGTGKYLGMVGAIQCITLDSKHIFNVGTGLTDEERQKYLTTEIVGKRVTVKYDHLSFKDKIPQLPVFVAFRDYE